MTDVCFWCNRAKGDVDGEPVYNDYNFCHTCIMEDRKGITIMQVTELPNGNPPIVDNLYPTGKWVVVSVDDTKRVLKDHPRLSKVLVTKKMYVNVEDWEAMNLP